MTIRSNNRNCRKVNKLFVSQIFGYNTRSLRQAKDLIEINYKV